MDGGVPIDVSEDNRLNEYLYCEDTLFYIFLSF